MNVILKAILGDRYEEVVERSKEQAKKQEEELKKLQEEQQNKFNAEIKRLISYPANAVVKANKTNLNKIIKWSTSRFNEYKKSEVVSSILEAIEKGENTIEHFICGTYSPRGGTGHSTGDYKLVIYQGVAKLVVDEFTENQKVYELVNG